MQERVGLVLTGGGARAAYQVGVLKAIAELLPRRAHNPFPVICGTSAGALNAATIAVNAQSFRKGVRYLNNIWKNFHADQVYRTDVPGVFNNSMKWFAGLLLSGLGIHRLRQVSLLDNSPLLDLLEDILPCEKIQESIDAGLLHALSVTASGYGSGQSVTFYQGVEQLVPWRRTRRIGVPAKIEIKHLLASSAIPFIFPAALINREYFGDGSMRQIAPISSALHLGADRVLVIGVRQETNGHAPRPVEQAEYPSLAQIGGHVLASIFLDALEADLERLRRINETVRLISPEQRAAASGRSAHLRPVEPLLIAPSQNIGEIAVRHKQHFPLGVRRLLRGIGAWQRSGGDLLSYLLFEQPFTRELIELGYADAMRRRDEIEAFFAGDEQLQAAAPPLGQRLASEG